MTTLTVQSLKVAIPFKEGTLPTFDDADPRVVIDLGGVRIVGKLNPKACRKASAHRGGGVLQGGWWPSVVSSHWSTPGFSFLNRSRPTYRAWPRPRR